MRNLLRRNLNTALKARDQVAVSALRSAVAAIDNAEAVDVSSAPLRVAGNEHFAGATAGLGSGEVERCKLSEADMHAIIRAQVDERSEAAREYERLGRPDVADRLRREADVLSAYLPALNDS
jgi:uncharacterized protein YqeY